MKKNALILLILLTSCQVFAQNEASIWYFGRNAGLQFNSENGSVTAITNGQINTLEGCTSIANEEGVLQFYTDGQTVWSRNHQIMPNGNYFGGTGLLGDPSSTSSGLIVPRPERPNQYYIFTVDEPHHDNAAAYPMQYTGVYTDSNGQSAPAIDDGFNNGLNYSLVDMNLNGGQGDVVPSEKNIELLTYDPTDELQIRYKCSEKITAVRAEDCSSFWVITHFIDTFYAFKVTEYGVATDENGDAIPVVTSIVGPTVPVEGYRRNALGYIKASPDASKLLVAHYGFATSVGGNSPGGVYLYDFDNDTGMVSNNIELYSPQNGNSPYGVEFSAENRKAYATIGTGSNGIAPSQVLQWDLESANIPNTLDVVHSSNTLSAGALQLGLDRRIYRAQLEFGNTNTGANRFLGVIENPEEDGFNSNYNVQGILLDINSGNQNTSSLGLPPFIQSLFNSEIDIIQNGISTTELALCIGDSYTLQAEDIVGADYVWSFDGTELTETSSQLFVDTPGFYEVYIEPNNGECPIEGNALVGVFEIPVANDLTDIIVCDDSTNDNMASFDFTDKNAEALLAQDPSLYNVSYYETQEAADSGENGITFPYTNISNPQTIFVRVENSENPNCLDTNTFTLTINNTPQITTLETIEFCDTTNDPTDGIAVIDLQDVIPEITGTQEESETAITFHASQNEAENNAAALPLNYTNTTPFAETIFVRFENTTNTNCFSTGSFDVVINPIPVANNISIIQCDEDGIPEGFTLFNITNSIDLITDNPSNNTVSFHLSQGNAQNGENAIDGTNFENFLNPQIIYARVTNSQTSCVNFSEITLTVSTTSSNNASMTLCDTDGTEDGFMSFNLTESNDTVLAGAPIGLNLTYYETYQDALLENNALGTTFSNTIAYNQTIYGRVENANACYGISEIELTVLELPNIETEAETLYCLNFSPETITLEGGVINDNPSNYYYEWSTGKTTTEIEVNAPGNYTVRVLNTNGCFKDRTITVLPSNIATITQIEVVDASQNNSISVFVEGEGDYEYALNDPNGSYQDSNTFTNIEPGLYTVYVRDKNNCGIAEDAVSVIGLPKFFTPNGDGPNDFWQVYG
ncbi:MAG: hypothetical protein AB8B52_12605, partial [Winogradskyella sp.]|uniref:hypothetical protein n=1 Tax=Winogradskyella sp. TaxID=1883156 RepID=UPI00385A89E8